jgi:hypothetical protein
MDHADPGDLSAGCFVPLADPPTPEWREVVVSGIRECPCVDRAALFERLSGEVGPELASRLWLEAFSAVDASPT